MNELNCKKLEINQLSPQIFQVRLKPIEGKVFDFKGGQYLYLLMPDGKRIPLSIASSPEQKDYLELHIRLQPGHDLAAEMMHLFENAKKIHVEGPYGQCFLKDDSRPCVIISGGTGFSPMKSLLESAFLCGSQAKFRLYLGAQKAEDFYQDPIIDSWRWPSGQFHYVPVVNEADDTWQGEIGFPHHIAIQQLKPNLNEFQFFISGSEPMVMNVYRTLLDAGADKAHIFSDMLDIKREIGEEI